MPSTVLGFRKQRHSQCGKMLMVSTEEKAAKPKMTVQQGTIKQRGKSPDC